VLNSTKQNVGETTRHSRGEFRALMISIPGVADERRKPMISWGVSSCVVIESKNRVARAFPTGNHNDDGAIETSAYTGLWPASDASRDH